MFCSYQKKTHIADIEIVLLLAIGRPLGVELVKCQLQLAFRCLAQVLIRKVIKYHKEISSMSFDSPLPHPTYCNLPSAFLVLWILGWVAEIVKVLKNCFVFLISEFFYILR